MSDKRNQSMQIGQISKQVGVSIDAIRFYERSGLLAAPHAVKAGFDSIPQATFPRCCSSEICRRSGSPCMKSVSSCHCEAMTFGRASKCGRCSTTSYAIFT